MDPNSNGPTPARHAAESPPRPMYAPSQPVPPPRPVYASSQPVPPQQAPVPYASIAAGWPGVVQPNVGQTNELSKPKRSKKRIILSGLLTAAMAGGVFGVWYQFIRVPQIDVFGFVTLHGKSTSSMGSCAGKGGYSDMSNGTSVIIRDAENKIIAATRLENGSGSTGNGCMFEFTATIPGKSDYYSVEVGHRGEVQFDKDGIRLPMLTLGGDN